MIGGGQFYMKGAIRGSGFVPGNGDMNDRFLICSDHFIVDKHGAEENSFP